ncbi:MAG: M14 family zinc carboxypeptidase [Bacteroidales bacterium]|nr:M14 family zinc carboxypeptidase [Bacteroidales bacterium]
MKNLFPILLFVFITSASSAQEKLDYFLPGDVSYRQDIPAPDQYFDQLLGQWHLTHDQVLSYMKEIARVSKRAGIFEYARSYENRPLVYLVFSSEENLEKMEELKVLHARYSDPAFSVPLDEVPLVVSLGYGVHGNESSATNASVLTAYYLAAAEGEKMDSLLETSIILVDPCLNPDGFTRHSTWANMNQGAMDRGDRNSRQFFEGWPGGRSNHYWFDLNRDYLLLVNPESRGRVEQFHEWKPNVLTDHHESGPDFTFFFQPGIPSRIHPLTPAGNHELTCRIGEYHAAFLDETGSYYFSEESFDDYYFGKGSTYPDINAGIGILFEQAAFRGRVRGTSHGVKTLAEAIKNQFTVSLSTLEASRHLRTQLLEYQRDFYITALELGRKSDMKAYVFGSETDRVKTQKFIEFLNRHQIRVYENERDITDVHRLFKAGYSYVVPAEQEKYRLLTSIFEEVTTFQDTSFYDISTWTIPHAMGIPFTRIESGSMLQMAGEPVLAEKRKGKVLGGRSRLGYLFRWNEYTSPEALYKLQQAGLQARVAHKEFSYRIEGVPEDFIRGTILVRTDQTDYGEEELFALISEIAASTGIDFYSLSTGLSPLGIDLGSSSFSILEKPEILMFTDGRANVYLAGEIWHLLDQVYRVPVTRAPVYRLSSMDLDRYNTLILPGGTYQEWDPDDLEKLTLWVRNGGTLLACKDASSWAALQGLGNTSLKEPVPADTMAYLAYDERQKESVIQGIGGAILKANMDLTHPLCYGYLDPDLAIFKRGRAVVNPSGVKYSEPVRFDSQPYVSGWVSEENLERIQGAPVVSVHSVGRGKVISYHEDMNFRGIWLGTHKLFANALFFGSVIR